MFPVPLSKSEQQGPAVAHSTSNPAAQVCSPRAHLMVMAALAVAVGCMTLLYQRTEVPSADTSAYAGLAASLLRDGQYRFNYEFHTEYPPGVPVLFAAAGYLFGLSYPLRMIVTGACAFLGLLAGYLFLRPRATLPAAAAIVLLLATSRYFCLYVTSKPMADMAYFAFGMWTLYLADLLKGKSGFGLGRLGLSVLLALCVVLLVTVRMTGAAMLPCLLVYAVSPAAGKGWGFRGRLPLLLAAGVGILAVTLWMQWAARHAPVPPPGLANSSYFKDFTLKDFHDPAAGLAGPVDVVERIWSNWLELGAAVSELTFRLPWLAPWLWSPLVIIPNLTILLGLVQSLRRVHWDLADLYVAATLLMVLAWWFSDDPLRFMFPLFPLLALQAMRAAGQIGSFLRERRATAQVWAIFICAGAFVASAIALALQHERRGKQQLLSVAVWGGFAVLSLAWRRWGTMIPARVARSQHNGRRACIRLASLVIVVSFGLQTADALRRLHQDPREMLHYPSLHAASWLRANTEAGAVVLCKQAYILHFLTGRKTVPMPYVADPDTVRRLVLLMRVDHIVVDDMPPFAGVPSQAILAALEAAPGPSLTLAATGPGYKIYRVRGRQR
jgi:hypothetical protein